MGNNLLMVVAVAAVALSILYLAKVLSVKSSERAAPPSLSLAISSKQKTGGSSLQMVSNTTPIAMPNETGRLITHGSVSAPPEPGGYIADSEITQVTPPSMIRQYIDYDNMYMHTTFGPDSMGEVLYPWKTGHYVRSGYW